MLNKPRIEWVMAAAGYKSVAIPLVERLKLAAETEDDYIVPPFRRWVKIQNVPLAKQRGNQSGDLDSNDTLSENGVGAAVGNRLVQKALIERLLLAAESGSDSSRSTSGPSSSSATSTSGPSASSASSGSMHAVSGTNTSGIHSMLTYSNLSEAMGLDWSDSSSGTTVSGFVALRPEQMGGGEDEQW